MATPESWHDHAAAAIRKARRHKGDSDAAPSGAYQREERYVVRNSAGEVVREGLVPPNGIVLTYAGEDIEIVPEHQTIVPDLVRKERNEAWRAGYRVGFEYGEMSQRGGPFGILLAWVSGLLIGAGVALIVHPF